VTEPSRRPPILVTGAGTGIGRAIVEHLSREACPVYATARKASALDVLGRLPHVTALKLDVTRPDDAQGVAERVRKARRGLHGLVNNAGTIDYWPLAGMGADEIHRVVDVNLYGVHRVTRALLPSLMKSRGRIVNISSIAGIGTWTNNGAYNVSKHALEAYSEVLAMELRPHGVRVSLIEPGNYESELLRKAAPLLRRRAKSSRASVMRAEARRAMRKVEEYVDPNVKEASPVAVAEVVFDALYSDRPQARYVVTPNKSEFLWPLESLFARAAQVNEGSRYRLSVTQLRTLLDKQVRKAARRRA